VTQSAPLRGEDRLGHPIDLHAGAVDDPVRSLREETLTLRDTRRRYCTLVFFKTGRIMAAAEALGAHRSTVAESIDHELLAKWRRST
jgi:hypothetical protein